MVWCAATPSGPVTWAGTSPPRSATKLLGEAREQALDRMVAEAKEIGANAIVMVRFSTSMVMSGAAELLAYGTAVVVEPE